MTKPTEFDTETAGGRRRGHLPFGKKALMGKGSNNDRDEFYEILHARRLLKICDIAVDMTAEERTWFLSQACVGDDRLCEDVNRLLKAMAEVEDFMERGPTATRNRR